MFVEFENIVQFEPKKGRPESRPIVQKNKTKIPIFKAKLKLKSYRYNNIIVHSFDTCWVNS